MITSNTTKVAQSTVVGSQKEPELATIEHLIDEAFHKIEFLNQEVIIPMAQTISNTMSAPAESKDKAVNIDSTFDRITQKLYSLNTLLTETTELTERFKLTLM